MTLAVSQWRQKQGRRADLLVSGAQVRLRVGKVVCGFATSLCDVLELSTWAVKRKSCRANCCPLVHLVIACYILYKHVRSGPWYHDRKLYDIYCTNMFVLVRGITTVNCMISTAQTCSFWSVVSLVLFAALQHPVRELIPNVVRCVL